MKEFKLLIMGNDGFKNEEILLRTLAVIQETVLKDRSISFVNAMLPGADALAYMLANQNKVKCYEFNLNRRLAGDPVMRVHAEMADFSDGALIFCAQDDDVDYMINYMQMQNKKVAVVHYST
jgi:hypothetical protein